MLDRRLRIAQYVFAVVGLAAAIYLTYSKYEHAGVCGVSAGCTIVQQSEWSELFGIPVSVLGIVGYVGFLGLLTAPQKNELVRLGLVVGTGVGFLFSMFLMYRAYITLDAFCPFCTTSAVMMTLLAITSTVRFVRGPDRPVAAGDDGLLDDDATDEDEDDAPVGVAGSSAAGTGDGPRGTTA
jgi:uncharacterized membrane protein